MINCEQLPWVGASLSLSLFPIRQTSIRRRHCLCFTCPFLWISLFWKVQSFLLLIWVPTHFVGWKYTKQHQRMVCHSKDSWRGKGGIDCWTKHTSSNRTIQKCQLWLINATARNSNTSICHYLVRVSFFFLGWILFIFKRQRIIWTSITIFHPLRFTVLFYCAITSFNWLPSASKSSTSICFSNRINILFSK